MRSTLVSQRFGSLWLAEFFLDIHTVIRQSENCVQVSRGNTKACERNEKFKLKKAAMKCHGITSVRRRRTKKKQRNVGHLNENASIGGHHINT